MAWLNVDLADLDVVCRLNNVLHLHGLDRREVCACLDLVALFNKDFDNSTRHRRLCRVGYRYFTVTLLLKECLLNFDLERGAFIVKLCDYIVLQWVNEVVDIEQMVVSPNNQVVRLILRHVTLSIQNYRGKLAIFILSKHIESVLIQVLHKHGAFIGIIGLYQD